MDYQNNQLAWKVQQSKKELDLSYCVFLQDLDFVSYLKTQEAKQLQSINLSHTLLSDASLLQLSYLTSKQLQHLDISYCVNFTEGAIVNLLNSEVINSIQILNLSGNQLSDVCLKFLFLPNKMKNLAQIYINDIKKGQQGFTYKFFEFLASTNLSKSLTTLYVGNSFIQIDQLQFSKAQTLMNSLFNRIIKEDHTFFYQLSLKSTSITKLVIFKCELLTNKFIKMLCRNIVFMSTIKTLNIGHCKLLTDKICHYLSEATASVQKLLELELLGLSITNEGLEKLAKSKQLQLTHLGLAMCDELQSESIKQLMDSKFGKCLTSLEISGSCSTKSQIVGMFSQEQIIWKDFNLKTLYIELFSDKGCYYQNVGKQQLQFQQQQIHPNVEDIDPYYKSFFETHFFSVLDQIIFIKKIKVVIKVQYTDEDQIAQYLTNYIEKSSLLDQLLQNDNHLFVNDICILAFVLQSITKAQVKIIEAKEMKSSMNSVSIIQVNYIDPIFKEKITASSIRNLILIKQDTLRDEDLELIGRYQDSIFAQLSYIQIKGCKQISKTGLYQLQEKLIHQLQFLDIRNTKIKLAEHSEILTNFKNLTSFNNNKIELEFNSKETKDDVQNWTNLLFRLLQLKKLSIKNTNKQSTFNMSLMRFTALMVKNNHLSIKKLSLQFYLNISDFLLYSEESITDFCEGLLLSFNITTFSLEIIGLVRHQLLIDIFNTVINTQISKFTLQLQNCNIIDEVFLEKNTCTHSFQFLQFNITNLSLLENVLLQTCNLDELVAEISLNENKYDSLIYLVQKNTLKRMKISFETITNEQLLKILTSINTEQMKTMELHIENLQLNELVLQQIQELLIRSKKLYQFEIDIIGYCDILIISCGCSKSTIEKYFTCNLQVLRIPQLKFYY